MFHIAFSNLLPFYKDAIHKTLFGFPKKQKLILLLFPLILFSGSPLSAGLILNIKFSTPFPYFYPATFLFGKTQQSLSGRGLFAPRILFCLHIARQALKP